MAVNDDNLVGLRVLVVEDTQLVADTIQDVLDEFGCIVLGPVATVAAGEALARDENPGCALLDIRLGAEDSFPIADVLLSRGVPFVFLTGEVDQDVPDAHRDVRRLAKPFQMADLIGVVTDMAQPARAG